MRYRPLGRSGLTVSAVSLGTVSLGLDYGINAPGDYGRPDEDSAIGLLRHAADRGVTLIDTAPTYGTSERLVGRALGGHAATIIATKIKPDPDHPQLRAEIDASLAASRAALGRDTLDIVQIHNATVEVIAGSRVIDALEQAKRRGEVRCIGASVYGEEAAMAAVTSGRFDLVQLTFSVLDQRMAARVFPAAERAGVGLLARSALLKGALTPKAPFLPESLAPLRDAAARARDLLAGGSWDALPGGAMRFCLSVPALASVLVGARTAGELDAALDAEAQGPLADSVLEQAARIGLDEERLLNPMYWPIQ